MSAPVEGKKKRGKPSDIKGARHEFLQGHLDGYNTASAKKKTRQFWTKVFVPYWAAFPWRLPLDQDPDRANPFDYALAPRTPAEEEEKRKVIAETEAKLKLWFCRQAKGGGGKDNPWAAWLKRLRTPTTAAPKRLSDWQFYMQHDDFKDRVTAAYEIRKEGVAEKDLLNKRGEVARELLAAEPQEVRNRILREIEEEHAALREKHEDAVEGLPAIDEEGREEARLRFSSLVVPLLDGLAAHTGYAISILAGRVKSDGEKLDIESVSLHAGVTATTPPMLDFSKADPKAYAEMMRNFSKFVWNANEFREGRVAAQPTSVQGGSGMPASTTPPPRPVTLRLAEPRTQNPGDIVPVCFTAPVSENHVPSLHLPDDRRDDFPDGEIDVHGKDLPILDEFDFPADLLGGPVPNPLLLDAPPAIDPYGSDFAGPLNSDVLMLLDEMSPPEREARLAELRAMDAEALKRANIAARNYQMLSGLGLGNAQKETLWAGAVAPPATKRKAATDGRQTKGKRTRKRKDPVEEVSEAEEEEDSDDAPDEPPVEKPKKPVPEAKQVQKGPSGREGATPKWAETAQRFLTSTELGSEWAALLVLWYGREKRAGFEGTTKSHPAKLRPKEVKDWVSRARNHTPTIAAADAFGKGWWAWWIDINPDWRGSERPLSREGDSWERMDLYGINAFLNVLMALKWWRDAMREASPDWEEAVAEVTWVLQEMERDSGNGTLSSSSVTTVTAASASPAALGPSGSQIPGAAPPRVQHHSTRSTGMAPNEHQSPPIPSNDVQQRGSGPIEESECAQKTDAQRGGLEGLSQEELDELAADPEADMDG